MILLTHLFCKLTITAMLFLMISHQGASQDCIESQSTDWNDDTIINDLGKEIFKIEGIKLFQGKYNIFIPEVIRRMETTYLLTDRTRVKVCHGPEGHDQVADFRFAEDDFLKTLLTYTGAVVDSLEFRTIKGTNYGPYGGQTDGTTTFEQVGHVIKAFQGSSYDFIEDDLRALFQTNTILRSEISGDIQYTQRESTLEDKRLGGNQATVTVENIDPDAAGPQTQVVEISEEVSEEETVSVTSTSQFSFEYSLSVSASVDVGIVSGEVSQSFTAGFGFEESLQTSQTTTKTRTLTVSTIVEAQPGTRVTATAWFRQGIYDLSWEAPGLLYYTDNPDQPVATTLSGVLEGVQATDSFVTYDIEVVWSNTAAPADTPTAAAPADTPTAAAPTNTPIAGVEPTPTPIGTPTSSGCNTNHSVIAMLVAVATILG
jgi:hypothetical protein